MKELSVEQKAKRYDEVLAMAKECLKDGTITSTATGYIETIFPELKKSEDERIRKWLINEIKINHHNLDEDSVDFVDKAIAWLERQGADKVEPKFKVGDWINGYYTNYKVLSVNNEGYVVEDVDGNKINILFENEKFHHLWTIEDAKDGDVLATEDWVFIFKKINSKREPTCYCHYDIELGFFIDTNSYIATGSEIYPATKEQRDTLERAMANAGYTFDFNMKELKKIEQNPAWSEEDKDFMYDTLSNLTELKDRFGEEYGNVGKCIKWLKSIKEKVQPQNTWKPSDEQNEALEHFVRSIGESGYASPYDNNTKLLYSLLEQLKKLKG